MGNDGTVQPENASRKVEGGNSLGSAMPPAPTRDGYTFLGWDTERDGTGSDFTATTIVTGDITVYAQWKEQDGPTIQEKQYIVTFDGNAPRVTGPNPGSKTVTPGSAYGTLATVSRSGYSFLGWYTAPRGGTRVTARTIVTNAFDHTLYAHWQEDRDDPGTTDPPTPPTPQTPPTQPQVYPPIPIDPDDPIYTNIEDWLPPLGHLELDKFYHKWYICGYPDNTMQPARYITRAEIAMIFYRLTLDQDKAATIPRAVFTDIDPNAWYAKAVTYLYDGDIIKGYGDGTFRPNAYVTRAEATAMAIKFDTFTLPSFNPFYDLTTDHWAAIPILAAWNNGWLFGYAEDATIRPDEKLTRAEMVVFMNRVLNRLTALEDIPADAEGFIDLSSTHWAYSDIIEAANSHNYDRKYADKIGNYDQLDEIWTLIIGHGKNSGLQD